MAKKKAALKPVVRVNKAALKQVAQANVRDLYVRAVIPSFAWGAIRNNDYSPCYLGHAIQESLEQSCLRELFAQFLVAEPEAEEDSGLDSFVDWLDKQDLGYVVFQPFGTGLATIVMDEENDDEGDFFDEDEDDDLDAELDEDLDDD